MATGSQEEQDSDKHKGTDQTPVCSGSCLQHPVNPHPPTHTHCPSPGATAGQTLQPPGPTLLRAVPHPLPVPSALSSLCPFHSAASTHLPPVPPHKAAYPHLSPPLGPGGSRTGGDGTHEGKSNSKKLCPALLTWDTCQRHSSSHMTLPSFFTLTAFECHLNLSLWLTGPPILPEGH